MDIRKSTFLVLLLVVLAVALVPTLSRAETVRDEFNNVSYDNNDGTNNWSGPWHESGDDDDVSRGDVRVTQGPDHSRYVMMFRDNNRGAYRRADLSGAASATLSYSYFRDHLDRSSDYVAVFVSGDGGGHWTELTRHSGPDNDSGYVAVSYDISAYISNNTVIAFDSSSSLGNDDRVYFDDVQILYTTTNRHFAIAHDGMGDNCNPEPVTIAAHDASHNVDSGFTGSVDLSTSTGHGSWSVISGNGTLSDSGGGNAAYTFVAADNGTVTLGLRDSADETVNVDISDGTLTEEASEDPDLVFFTTGVECLPVGDWRMENDPWGLTAIDSSGNGLDGIISSATTQEDTDPALGGTPGTCQYAGFNGTVQSMVEIAHNSLLAIPEELTVSLWFNAKTLPSAGSLSSILSKDENYEFHIDGSREIYWWWNSTSGAAHTYTTNGANIQANQWYHVSIVYSRSTADQVIYLNGVPFPKQEAGADRDDLMMDSGDPLQIGQDMAFSGREFDGFIDEVRVYSSALSQSQIQAVMNATHPCSLFSVDLDHYRIEHDGQGLTCQPEEVTVRACLNADCTDEYANPVDVTLSPGGWVGGDVQTINGGSGVLYLRHTQAESVSLGVSSSAPAATNPTECFVSGVVGSCDVLFHATGFVFQVPDFESCQGTTVTMRAVQLDDTTQACTALEGFGTQTKAVSFWSGYSNPATGSRSVQVNGSSVAVSSPGTAITLTFDTAASTELAINYNDAGQAQLDARYLGSGDDAGLELVGSDTFISYPNRLNVEVTSDGSTSLNNMGSSGDPHWPSGEDFQVKVSGVCQDGSVTTNFAWPTTLTAITPFAPASGTLGSMSNGSIALTDFSSGSSTVTDAQYSEVGNFTLQANAVNYLAPGIDIQGDGGVVGRFTPHHFEVSTNTPMFGTACSGGNFTYIGQVFDYTTKPVLTVSARNKQNFTTRNYTGAWWKITDGSLSGKQYNVISGTLDLSLVPSPDPVIAENPGTGAGTLAFSSGGGMRFVRGAPEADFDAEISLGINVVDSDGIVYSANPARFGLPTLGFGMAFDNGKEMRYGRLVLENAYGSELLNLPVSASIQYFDGSGFVTNTDDSCTAWDTGLLTLTSAEESVAGAGPIRVKGTVDTTATLSPALFSNGLANLLFSAPGSGGDGWVDIDLELGGLSWLRFDWDGNGFHDNNPASRATFGIFKSNPRLIYQRESVN